MSTMRLIAAVAGLILAQPVVATIIAGQTTPPSRFDYDTYTQLGAGGSDCGTMTSNLQADRGKFQVPYLFWEQGFLTGANFAARQTKQGDPHIGKGRSTEFLLTALEQYCEQHPLDNVGDAVSVVHFQLAGR